MRKKKPKKKYLYILVTNDELELPLIIEETGQELAAKMGISKSVVSHRIDTTKKGTNTKEKIYKIEV